MNNSLPGVTFWRSRAKKLPGRVLKHSLRVNRTRLRVRFTPVGRNSICRQNLPRQRFRTHHRYPPVPRSATMSALGFYPWRICRQMLFRPTGVNRTRLRVRFTRSECFSTRPGNFLARERQKVTPVTCSRRREQVTPGAHLSAESAKGKLRFRGGILDARSSPRPDLQPFGPKAQTSGVTFCALAPKSCGRVL